VHQTRTQRSTEVARRCAGRRKGGEALHHRWGGALGLAARPLVWWRPFPLVCGRSAMGLPAIERTTETGSGCARERDMGWGSERERSGFGFGRGFGSEVARVGVAGSGTLAQGGR